jgi:hypothetical protein
MREEVIMAQTNLYDRIFEYSPTDVTLLAFTDPEDVVSGAESRRIVTSKALPGSRPRRHNI